MVKKNETIAAALDALATQISSSAPNEQTLAQVVGWNAPPLNRDDLSRMVTNLAGRIRSVDAARIAENYDPSETVQKIDQLKSHVGNFWNQNAVATYTLFSSVLDYIESQFGNMFVQAVDWERAERDQALPKAIARKIRSLKSRVESALFSIDGVEEKISVITEAYDAAERLPTDLETLRESAADIKRLRDESDNIRKEISDAKSDTSNLLDNIRNDQKEAATLVGLTAEAHSAATTKGLAEAFQDRADRTAKSMWVWVSGLVIALGAGAGLGAYRASILETLLERNASASLLTINMMLSLLSIAAPVWLAWIATKQIGQRFRLSEDYAYKASVAKAYEGYRREANRVDPEQAARLFKIAVDKLDEAPLRFVENETYGSPWHEALRLRRSSNKLIVETKGVVDQTAVAAPSRASRSPRTKTVEE